MIDKGEFADFLEYIAVLIRKDIVGGGTIPDSKYPPDFVDAIKQVLIDEGGYSNDPADPGGETNFGIDKRSHPDVDIKNLTVDQAIEIYYQEYWQKYRLDLLPALINKKMLNVGVNTGMKQAALFLQRAVGVLADGQIGPITRTAVANADVGTTLQSIRDQQRQFYINLANAKPSLAKFLNGWLKRAAE